MGDPQDPCTRALELASAELDGQADDDELRQLDAHLTQCTPCRSTVASYAVLHRRIRVRPADDPPDPSSTLVAIGRRSIRQRHLRRQLRAGVAAAAVVALGMSAMSLRPSPEPVRSGTVQVTAPRLTSVEPGDAAVLKFTIVNDTRQDDSLVSIDVPGLVSGSVELHITGDTGMRSVDELVIASASEKRFDDTGSHVMLVDVAQPLLPGQEIPVTFRFAISPAVTISVPVA